MQSFDSLTGFYIYSFLNLPTNTTIAAVPDNHMVKRMVMKKENKKKKEINGRERDDDAASLHIVGD